MKSVTESALPAALSSVRSMSNRVISTATVTVNWGTVVALKVSRSAITRRIRLICRGAESSAFGSNMAGSATLVATGVADTWVTGADTATAGPATAATGIATAA